MCRSKKLNEVNVETVSEDTEDEYEVAFLGSMSDDEGDLLSPAHV